MSAEGPEDDARALYSSTPGTGRHAPWRPSGTGPSGPAETATFGFIALMAALGAVTAISIDSVIPALGAIARDFGVEAENQRHWPIVTVFAGMAVSQLLTGPIADGLGRRPAAFVCFVVAICGSILCLLAQDFAWLLAGRALQGLGAGGLRVVSLSVTRDRFAGAEMARTVSLTTVVFIGVILFAPAVGSLITYTIGWHWIFAALIVQVALTAAWFAAAQPETLDPARRRPISPAGLWETMSVVATTRATIAPAFALGVSFGGMGTWLATAEPVLEGIYHLGPWLPVAFGGVSVVFGLMNFVNSQLVRRYGPAGLAIRGMAMACGGGIVGAVAFEVLYAGVPPLLLHLAWGCVPICAFALIYGNLSSVALEPMGDRAGAASSVVSALGTFTGALTSGFAGWMLDGTVTPLYLMFAVCGGLGLAIFSLRGSAQPA